jgi:hypothetical protein
VAAPVDQVDGNNGFCLFALAAIRWDLTGPQQTAYRVFSPLRFLLLPAFAGSNEFTNGYSGRFPPQVLAKQLCLNKTCFKNRYLQAKQEVNPKLVLPSRPAWGTVGYNGSIGTI